MALAAALALGGWYWCLIGVPVVVVQRWRLEAIPAAALLAGLSWLVLFAVTRDRRLFFPFTLYYAAMFGRMFPGGFAAGAGMIAGLFTMIRIEQEASFPVIAVELLVAVAAVFAAWLCRRLGAFTAAALSSIVAFAGLSL